MLRGSNVALYPKSKTYNSLLTPKMLKRAFSFCTEDFKYKEKLHSLGVQETAGGC